MTAASPGQARRNPSAVEDETDDREGQERLCGYVVDLYDDAAYARTRIGCRKAPGS